MAEEKKNEAMINDDDLDTVAGGTGEEEKLYYYTCDDCGNDTFRLVEGTNDLKCTKCGHINSYTFNVIVPID